MQKRFRGRGHVMIYINSNSDHRLVLSSYMSTKQLSDTIIEKLLHLATSISKYPAFLAPMRVCRCDVTLSPVDSQSRVCTSGPCRSFCSSVNLTVAILPSTALKKC